MDVLKHQQLVEELGGCGGLTRLVGRALVPQWKSMDPGSAGLVLDPAVGSGFRTLKLTEKPLLVIKTTQKCVLYLGKTKIWWRS